ncbi:MAG TPA: endonuclease/exonuclease/phosphatase family protein [Bacteroidia bacterium]|nr:endonuclease/exonuclease/phosphatase family protein [Bacteroidia bacterium]
MSPFAFEKRKSGFSGTILRAATLVFALFTILSAHVSLVSPALFWYIAILGLFFPFFLIINLIFLIIWLLRRRVFLFVPLAALLLCIPRLPEYFQIDGKPVPQSDTNGKPIKVMSYNVRLFDLYNWTHNKETRASIFAYFDKEQPDILCMQEFFNSTGKLFHNETDLKTFLKAKYAHVEYPIILRGADCWGIATYSTFPIVGKGVLYFDEKTANICIYTDIATPQDTIRVYNCHLQSVRFRDEDYRFFEDLGEGQEEMEKLRSTRRIISRLRRAYIKRASQAELIAAHIKESPYPVILCGDFNDTPASYTYQTISDHLIDSFRESGSGTGTSYAGPLPGLRIDYLLHSDAFKSFGFETQNIRLSDHFPIQATLFRKKQPL